MYTGSCLCGQIEFRLDGPISSIIHCHCSLCRKSSGTAYSTNGFVDTGALRIVRGLELVTSFEYKPGRRRFFCSVCGAPIYSTSELDRSRVRIRLGSLDSDISERPMAHTFITSKANWELLDSNLPRFEEFEPGRHRKIPTDG